MMRIPVSVVPEVTALVSRHRASRGRAGVPRAEREPAVARAPVKPLTPGALATFVGEAQVPATLREAIHEDGRAAAEAVASEVPACRECNRPGSVNAQASRRHGPRCRFFDRNVP
jgi:hypothetical protein